MAATPSVTNYNSNVSEKLLRRFAAEVEANAVTLKAIDRQTLNGEYDETTGGTVSMKRPHLASVARTTAGDISSETTTGNIVSGKITGIVQNMATVWSKHSLKDESLSFDQRNEILMQRARQLVTEVETDIERFIIDYGGICVGTVGTQASTQAHVAAGVAQLQELGAPEDDIYCVMSPYAAVPLQEAQTGIYSETKVNTAWESALVSRNFGGAVALKTRVPVTYSSMAATDRAGTLSANPDVTYVTAKDTMRQTLAVTGLNGGSTVTIKAGDVIEFTDSNRYLVNQRTGNTVLDETMTPIQYRCTVLDDTSLTSGAGNVIVSGAGLYESGSAYNTTSAALASGDNFSVLGTTGATYRPNLIFHKSAVAIGFIKLAPFRGQDSKTITMDGLSIRMSEGTDIETGKTVTRFDCHYALAISNPFWAGKLYG